MQRHMHSVGIFVLVRVLAGSVQAQTFNSLAAFGGSPGDSGNLAPVSRTAHRHQLYHQSRSGRARDRPHRPSAHRARTPARAIVRDGELAVHGPPNPPPGAVPSIPNRRDHLKSPATSLGRTLRVKINSLGKPCLYLGPAPDGRSAPCPPHRHARATRQSPGNCRGRGAVDSGERQGRQSKIDILAGPHACGGREPFGTGKVRRHDLPRRSSPLSRTWLITFWTPAMFRACVVTLSSSGRLLAMPIRYTIPFTVSTV